MLTRLNGLVLIINALLPPLFVLAVAGLFIYYKGDVEDGWINEIRPELEAIQNAATVSIVLVDNAVTNASAKITSAANGLDAVATQFEKAAATVAEPLKTLGAVTVPKYTVSWDHHKVVCPGPNKKDVFGKPIKPCIPNIHKGDFKLGEALTRPFTNAFEAMTAAAQLSSSFSYCRI